MRLLQALLCTSAIAAFWPGAVVAQTAAPTAEQLKALEGLSTEQRKALLESLGKEGVPTQEQPVPEFPPTVTPVEPPQPLPDATEALRVGGGETLVIRFTLIADLPATEERAVTEDRRLARLMGSRTYQLDAEGVLELPGIARMPLSGLTAEEVATRISAEPLLRNFDVVATILPLKPTGVAALEPFGYSLFEGVPSTFAPATDIPVPTDYIIGPGDTVNVQLFGKSNAQYVLAVSRDGQLNFPEIGPINVSGLTFDQMREEISARVGQQKIGVSASVTMGPLRSIRVFVLGDATRPGSYTVSSLATITNALFASGGVNKNGSLRRIELKRNGRSVQGFDLYDLLLRGDTSDDARLMPGDVIFIPPIGATAAADGEVNRPAIYELNGEQTVAALLALAGGARPAAFAAGARLERIGGSFGRSVLPVDLSSEQGRNARIQSGDVLRVFPVLDRYEESVALVGHVFRPGSYQWHRGMRLSELLATPALLKPGADQRYILIRRERLPERSIEALSADLTRALAAPGGSADPLLQPLDRVHVFDLEVGRAGVVDPLLAELRLYDSPEAPAKVAGIGGRVNAPGEYPLEPQMRISDLLRAGGGLDEAAYSLDAELTRFAVEGGELRRTDLITVDLAAVLAGDAQADLALLPHDYLNIKEIPQWTRREEIEIIGEVRFPGIYPLQRGETLSSVIERAGGLTSLAFPEGAIFTREVLAEREAEQIATLANRLENDLAAASLQSLQGDRDIGQAISVGQALLTQLRSTEPVGRLVIDFNKIMSDAHTDLVLRDGDRLYMPKQAEEVTVIGEVQYTTSHVYERGLELQDYVSRSGGFTQTADRKRVYIVRANGSVVTSEGSAWYQRRDKDVRPGDTIVAPLDADRIAPLTLWTSVTQIIYNLAIAVAAVNSF